MSQIDRAEERRCNHIPRDKAALVLSVQVGIIGGALGFLRVLLDLRVLALADAIPGRARGVSRAAQRARRRAIPGRASQVAPRSMLNMCAVPAMCVHCIELISSWALPWREQPALRS